MTITAYYDRQKGTVDGFFTLQEVDDHGNIVKLFNKLPARSGQKGYTETDWVRGKSPIPYGTHELHLNSINKREWAGHSGIGWFFPIASPGFQRKIEDPVTKLFRLDIGLHPENDFVGSAGCIVLLANTGPRKNEVLRLFEFLDRLFNDQKTIKLVVL